MGIWFIWGILITFGFIVLWGIERSKKFAVGFVHGDNNNIYIGVPCLSRSATPTVCGQSRGVGAVHPIHAISWRCPDQQVGGDSVRPQACWYVWRSSQPPSVVVCRDRCAFAPVARGQGGRRGAPHTQRPPDLLFGRERHLHLHRLQPPLLHHPKGEAADHMDAFPGMTRRAIWARRTYPGPLTPCRSVIAQTNHDCRWFLRFYRRLFHHHPYWIDRTRAVFWVFKIWRIRAVCNTWCNLCFLPPFQNPPPNQKKTHFKNFQKYFIRTHHHPCWINKQCFRVFKTLFHQ